MKSKFVSLFVAILMVLTGCACFVGCSKSEVELLGITSDGSSGHSASAEGNIVAMNSFMPMDDVDIFYPDGGDSSTLDEDVDENGNYASHNVGENYSIIYKTQSTIYFTINLSNPNNYYILDFRIACSEEGAYIRQGVGYASLQSKPYIRWDEAVSRMGNIRATYEIVLANPEVSPTSIRILDMYYSDRNDGASKTAVNLNDKDEYTIYKVDQLMMKNRQNGFDSFKFSIYEGSATDIKVTVDNVEYEPVEEVYSIPSGRLEIKFKYETDGKVRRDIYSETIQTLYLNFGYMDSYLAYDEGENGEREVVQLEKPGNAFYNSDSPGWPNGEHGFWVLIKDFGGTDCYEKDSINFIFNGKEYKLIATTEHYILTDRGMKFEEGVRLYRLYTVDEKDACLYDNELDTLDPNVQFKLAGNTINVELSIFNIHRF